MSSFVDQCRIEWRRLGVPDAIANEMAEDLTADLDEAAAEGASAEDVLGNGIFDPRSFAAEWAEARGVVGGPPAPKRRTQKRPAVVAAIAGLVALMIAVMGLLALAFAGGSSSMVAPGQTPRSPGEPAVSHLHWAFPFQGPLHDRTALAAGGVGALCLVALALGVVALVVAAVRWAPWNRYGHPDPRG